MVLDMVRELSPACRSIFAADLVGRLPFKVSRRTIQRCMIRLEQQGLLVRLGERSGFLSAESYRARIRSRGQMC